MACLHLERHDISLVHQKVKGSDQIAQVGIDADIVLKCTSQIYYVLLVHL